MVPIGRLDFATSGILLCTNDGEMSDGLLHPRKEVPKTYVVKVRGLMTPDDLDVWRNGVRLEDGMTLPAQAKMLRHEGDKTWIELTIKEGRNQQIRRMGEATRFPVMRLARVSFAGIDLEGLAPGRWRSMTRDELMQLKKTYGVPRSIPSATPLVQPASKKPVRTQDARKTERTAGARYGGGAPGRRSPETKSDWGGGVRRGSSQRDEAPESRDDNRGHGGRMGRTRTTGTGGGIGARGPTDRVKGRRGR